jgi:hypothetical protein
MCTEILTFKQEFQNIWKCIQRGSASFNLMQEMIEVCSPQGQTSLSISSNMSRSFFSFFSTCIIVQNMVTTQLQNYNAK